jgi:hypothetical protein
MAMNQSFDINFKYPFKEKKFSIELTGKATLHHSTPHYIISNIRFVNHPDGPRDALPEIKIRQREIHGEKVWVHVDTLKESELSRIVGESIDEYIARSGQ